MANAAKRSGRWAATIASLAIVALVAMPASSNAGADQSGLCAGEFEGAFLDGPLEGLSMNGDLVYSVASNGRLTGLLTATDDGGKRRKTATVTGTVSKRQVRLNFRTTRGLKVTGTGSASGVRSCKGELIGRLKSARGGTGEWKARTSGPLVIHAPSFHEEICGGAPAGIALFNDGRIYDCSKQGFVIF